MSSRTLPLTAPRLVSASAIGFGIADYVLRIETKRLRLFHLLLQATVRPHGLPVVAFRARLVPTVLSWGGVL